MAIPSKLVSWPSRVNMHQPIVRYIHICAYRKKKLSEGSLGVCFFKNISYRDYLQRGVKAGINYPYTCVVACIRLIKIPFWPTIVVENKDFCQHHLQLWMVFLGPRSKATFWDRLALGCQLRGEYDKITCFHPLEHFLYHIQSFKAHESTFLALFLTLSSANLSKWPKMSPREPPPTRTNPPILGQWIQILKFRRKHMKVHKNCCDSCPNRKKSGFWHLTPPYRLNQPTRTPTLTWKLVKSK